MTSENISDLMQTKNPQKFRKMQSEGATEQIDQFFSQLKQATNGEVGAPPQEQPESFMDMQAQAPVPQEMENV